MNCQKGFRTHSCRLECSIIQLYGVQSALMTEKVTNFNYVRRADWHIALRFSFSPFFLPPSRFPCGHWFDRFYASRNLMKNQRLNLVVAHAVWRYAWSIQRKSILTSTQRPPAEIGCYASLDLAWTAMLGDRIWLVQPSSHAASQLSFGFLSCQWSRSMLAAWTVKELVKYFVVLYESYPYVFWPLICTLLLFIFTV